MYYYCYHYHYFVDYSTQFQFHIEFRAQMTDINANASDYQWENENVYILLAVMHFDINQGNVYILMSTNGLFINVNDGQQIWESPKFLITESSWHRLEIKLPGLDANAEQYGMIVSFDLNCKFLSYTFS